MRRKDREVTDIHEILAIVGRAKILHMGLFDGDHPYIVPLHYGYEYHEDRHELVFFMHGAKEGHKLDLIRKNARRGEIASLEPEQKADVDTLEGRVLRTERDEALHRAMSELCEEYRAALYLVYFENMSHEEVAKAMKKSRKQTENVIFRARRALRALLEKEGFTYEDLR